MFDWQKFLVLAGSLLIYDDEEYIRTAISRYYYGLFGVLRRYLINVKHKYYLKNSTAAVHRKVYDELRFSNDSSEKQISHVLNKLRVIRNSADYDDQLDVVEFNRFLAENKKDLEIANDTIGYFRNHPNY